MARPSGAYSAKNARWSFENSLRSGFPPSTALWITFVGSLPFIEAEHT